MYIYLVFISIIVVIDGISEDGQDNSSILVFGLLVLIMGIIAIILIKILNEYFDIIHTIFYGGILLVLGSTFNKGVFQDSENAFSFSSDLEKTMGINKALISFGIVVIIGI